MSGRREPKCSECEGGGLVQKIDEEGVYYLPCHRCAAGARERERWRGQASPASGGATIGPASPKPSTPPPTSSSEPDLDPTTETQPSPSELD